MRRKQKIRTFLNVHLAKLCIVAFTAGTGGWTQNVPSDFEALSTVCGNSKDVEVERGFRQHGVALTDMQLWREDFTDPWYGRSYTLAYPDPQEANWRTDNIHLHVNKSDSLDRKFFLHDPNYYIFNLNKRSLPINLQTLDASMFGRFYISLELTERVEHNTPSDPCMEDASYSFMTCVKESLSARPGAGCHGTPSAP